MHRNAHIETGTYMHRFMLGPKTTYSNYCMQASCTTKLLNFGPCVEGLREFINIKELKVVIFHIIKY